MLVYNLLPAGLREKLILCCNVSLWRWATLAIRGRMGAL